MNQLPRRTLRQLIAEYGPTLLNDPARLDALLADLCGEYPRERFLLVHALRGRAVTELRPYTQRNEAHELRLAQRLQQRYCFSAEAANWAVESWSLVLSAGETTEPINLEKAQKLFDTAVERYNTANARLNEAQDELDKVVARGKTARTELKLAQSKLDAAVERCKRVEDRSTRVQGEAKRAVTIRKNAETELKSVQSKFNQVVRLYRRAEARRDKAQEDLDKAIANGEIARTELEVESQPLVPDGEPLNLNRFRESKEPKGDQAPFFSESLQSTLSQLLSDYGPILLNEPARVDALLADLCRSDSRERFLLIHALRQHIPSELQTLRQNSADFERRFSQQLQNRYGFSSEAADWSIDSWLFALKGSIPHGHAPSPIDNPSSSEEEDERAPNPPPPPPPPRPKREWRGVKWLTGVTWLGLKGVLQGITWLIGMILLGLGRNLSRLSPRQKIWLGLGLMAIVAIIFEWKSVIAFTEWGIAWLLSIPGWSERIFSQTIDLTNQITAWFVGLPGLIVLGIMAGLVALRTLGLKGIWRGVTWLTRIILLGLSRMLGLLSPRQKTWLGLGLMAIVALIFEWQSVVVYTEWGIAWLLGIPVWIEEKLSQLVDHVVVPAITWLVGMQGLTALGAIAGLLAIRAIGPKRAWRGIVWLIGKPLLGLGRMLGLLSLHQKMWLGLGLIGMMAQVLTWQSVIV